MTLNKLTVAAVLLAVSTVSGATTILGNGLQNALDARSYDSAGTSISFLDVNANQASPDEVFELGASGVAASRLLFEFAGYAGSTSFGIYDINNTATRLEIFNGANNAGDAATTLDLTGNNFLLNTTYDNPSYTSVTTTQQFSSNQFGYYINVAATGNTYFSQTSKNADGIDHMVAFEGGDGIYFDAIGNGASSSGDFQANEYVLAWEDLYGGGDQDYTDFVVLVESVTAIVPEPSIVALMGFGLVGMGLATRRKQKKA